MPQTVPENLSDVPDLTAADIMPKDVPPVRPDSSVAEVLRVMVDHDVAGVAVVEDNVIIGIITESDVVARQAEPVAPLMVPFVDAVFVADAGRPYPEELRRALALDAAMLMTAPVTSVRAEATLNQIATIMQERDVHPMPVVDQDDRYIGIVSRRDLVRVIAELETRVQ